MSAHPIVSYRSGDPPFLLFQRLTLLLAALRLHRFSCSCIFGSTTGVKTTFSRAREEVGQHSQEQEGRQTDTGPSSFH